MECLESWRVMIPREQKACKFQLNTTNFVLKFMMAVLLLCDASTC